MAITRRQFVATFGALAAAAGIGQADIAKLTESFAYGNLPWHGTNGKPKVYWVHGAECTGCSTSLLGLFENLDGRAIEAVDYAGPTGALATAGISTGAAAGLATAPVALPHTLAALGVDPVAAKTLNIADVVVDIIDLKYHETIMGMGGDSAYAVLSDAMASESEFVLVVEGAVQDSTEGGYWNKTGDAAWCSIAADGTKGASTELKFDNVVKALAARAAGIVAIGQCATYGGYPASIGSGLDPLGNGATTKKQTSAYGVYDFLTHVHQDADAAKVVNVPGCPANPWWFVLTVVAWLIDANAILGGATNGTLGILKKSDDPAWPANANDLFDINTAAVDTASSRRLKAVYGCLNHGKYCPRYAYYAQRRYASKPGEYGCLKNLGCKGLSTMSLCTRHGWNGQQPQNCKVGVTALQSPAESAMLTSNGLTLGGNCLTAGAPCMGCTEKGYPDAFVPFIAQR